MDLDCSGYQSFDKDHITRDSTFKLRFDGLAACGIWNYSLVEQVFRAAITDSIWQDIKRCCGHAPAALRDPHLTKETRHLKSPGLTTSDCSDFRTSGCYHFIIIHLGGCQNDGPCWGPLNTRCRILLRTQRGTITLTTTHVPRLQDPRLSSFLVFSRCRSFWNSAVGPISR